MMLSYGMFAFEIGTLAYQELTRSRAWRFGRTPRFGAREASQFLGPGDDKVTLAGAIIPGLSGRFGSLETLADMGDEGKAWPLTDGSGNVIGTYVIDQLDSKASTFLVDGVPRKGDFTLTLTRVADEQALESAALSASPVGTLDVAQLVGRAPAAIALDLPAVADRIRQRLEGLNMSLPELARRAGLPQLTLDGIVSGGLTRAETALRGLAPAPVLTEQQLGLVAGVLDVSPEWLKGAVDVGFGHG